MPGEQTDDLIYQNGIDGESGHYSLPPMSGEELARFIKGEARPENLSELRFRYESRGAKHLGVKEGVDPKRLDQSGWGIVFPHDADPAVKEALAPLLELRRSQAGGLFRIYEGADGYRPGDTKSAFLARAPRSMGPGPADPQKVPYYLLICGSPEHIPYRFQSQLDVQYAVGRIHFDTLDEHANYARSVVEAETRPLGLAREVQLFGVANPSDPATGLSARQLVAPLKDQLSAQFGGQGWTFGAAMAEEATKSRLARLLGGGSMPALLFTASHGMDFPAGSPRQLVHQGALLCQDWPGPGAHQGKIPQDFYFAGDDLTADTNLLGLVAFFFACYGAGTPELDDFARQAFKDTRARIAPKPFLAGLPTRMLGLPRGGALAAIGHVERAWTYSFQWQKAGTQTEVFRSVIHRLLDGHPVGSALEYFNERYAELSTLLSDELEEIEFGRQLDPYDLAGMWTANNDARGYALIGDPAVRLPVAEPGEAAGERKPLQPRIAVSTGRPASRESGETGAAWAGPTAAPPGSAPGAPSESESAPGAFSCAQSEGEALTIRTWTARDPDGTGSKTLAVRTRVEANGDLETVVAEGYEGKQNLLDLHRAMVEQAIAARRTAG